LTEKSNLSSILRYTREKNLYFTVSCCLLYDFVAFSDYKPYKNNYVAHYEAQNEFAKLQFRIDIRQHLTNDIIKLTTCAEEDCSIGYVHHTRQTVFTSNDSTYSNQIICTARTAKMQCTCI